MSDISQRSQRSQIPEREERKERKEGRERRGKRAERGEGGEGREGRGGGAGTHGALVSDLALAAALQRPQLQVRHRDRGQQVEPEALWPARRTRQRTRPAAIVLLCSECVEI
eukprot:3564905-Rhodomonas_salina.1